MPNKLIPEMIPKTSFFINLRSMLRKDEWDDLRRATYRRANYVCEICSGKGTEHPVECHEVWDYNENTSIQKLVRCIALCPACHEAIHLGLAGVRGRKKQAMEHLKKVNGLSDADVQEIVDGAWKLWKRRNAVKWKMDITVITALGG